MKKQALLIFILSCSILTISFGQKDTLTLKINTRSFGDSIAVRWAPLNVASWKIGNDKGYQLVKKTIENDQIISTQILGIFKPASKAKLQSMANNELAQTAVDLLYNADLGMGLGGIELTEEDQQNVSENKFGFSLLIADVSMPTAKLLGLGYMDYEVENGKAYQYSIEIAEEVLGYILQKDVASIQPEFQPPLPKPDSLLGDWGDKKVLLRWPTNELFTNYSAYIIEKSTDEGETFQRINKTPYVPITPNHLETPERYSYFKDTLTENKKNYVYRIKGISPFGEIGEPSDTIWGRGWPAAINGNPIIYGITETTEQTFQIEWYFDEKLIDKVKGYNIYASRNNRKNFKKINSNLLSNQAKSFIDQNPAQVNFYKIEVVDVNDNKIPSVAALGQLVDHNPPAAPIGVTGVCDSTGKISLQWFNNQEEDLSGYYVYYGNSKEGEFAILTRTGDVKIPAYQDSVKHINLNEQRFYRIVAVDFRGNKSPFSETIKVKLPDHFAPVKPVFKQRKSLANKIYLSWANSSSDDVIKNELQRRKLNDQNSDWEVIYANLNEEIISTYEDSLVARYQKYEYRVMAYDDDNWKTASDTLVMKAVDDKKREAIEAFNVELLEDKRINRLTWKYQPNETIKEVVIFRKKNDTSFITYLKVPADTALLNQEGNTQIFEISDEQITKGNSYTYCVQITHEDGGESLISEKIELTLE